MLPPPVATGLPTRCGCAVAACRRLLLGTALDIMRPGAGASDPGMVSPRVFVAGASAPAETSTLRTGSNPAILFLLGDRLRPVTREDIRSIQALQQTAG